MILAVLEMVELVSKAKQKRLQANFIAVSILSLDYDDVCKYDSPVKLMFTQCQPTLT
jgi:hypothetical protein